MPVVHDIRAAHPRRRIDWVVEPAFAPLVRRCAGRAGGDRLRAAALAQAPLAAQTRQEWRAFRRRLRGERLRRGDRPAGPDQVGAGGARRPHGRDGTRFGLANRTEGSSHERRRAGWPTSRSAVEPRIHALDRSRELCARALGYAAVRRALRLRAATPARTTQDALRGVRARHLARRQVLARGALDRARAAADRRRASRWACRMATTPSANAGERIAAALGRQRPGLAARSTWAQLTDRLAALRGRRSASTAA